MNTADCAREQELLDALASSRWPEKCDTEMRAHVESCGACRDTLTVALPLLMEGEAAYADAQVPSSGVVWWRAQMRARREAERSATRPITIVQTIAGVCAAVFVVGAVAWLNPTLPAWRSSLHWFTASVETGAASLANASAWSPWGLLPWLALAVLMLVAPLAVYFAVTDE